MSLKTKIGGIFGLVPMEELKKSEARIRRQNNKIAKEVESVKKASSWTRLFAKGQEWKLFGEKVTKPFEQIPSVYKAIKAISDNVPQAVLKFRDKKSKKEVEDDEINALFDSPNPYMSQSDLIQAWVGFQSLYGESFIVKETSLGQAAGTRKLPAELWAFNPEDFQPITSGRLVVGWRYTQEQILFRPDQVIFSKDFNPHSLFRGANPLKPIDKIIDIDWQALVFNKAFFDNGANPGLMLGTESELSDDVIKRTTALFKEKYQGASNAHRVAILESGLKPVDHNPTHKDMEFIEQQKYSREEILGIWRAPKALFNITDDLNYATFIGQMKIFWSYGIMPVMKKVEGSINRQLVWQYNPKIEAYFDYSNVVAYQEDFKEKVGTGVQLSALGFTRNEINNRLQLGFEEKPWGDAWWAPFGLTPVTDAEKDEPETIPPPADPNAGKSIFDQKKNALWKGFVIKQGNLETKMSGAISKYFFEQRREALSELNKLGPEAFKLNWDDQNQKLKSKAEKWIYLAVKEGVDFGRSILGKKSLSDDQLDSHIRSFLSIRTDKITMINETVRKQLKNVIEESIANGETLASIADKFRDVYNMAASRSMMIARTETVGALNGGSQIYYESEGVQQKEWLTARDENVREAHKHMEGETVGVKNSFSNGLEYPGDQKGEPEEVINCRCTLLPVLER